MPYVTQSEDTHPVVEKLQFARLREMGRKERLERGLARVDEQLNLMWRAFERRYPDASPDELQVLWTRVQFGEELAVQLEKYLKCKTTATPSVRP